MHRQKRIRKSETLLESFCEITEDYNLENLTGIIYENGLIIEHYTLNQCFKNFFDHGQVR